LAQHINPFQNSLCTKSSSSPRSLAERFQPVLCFRLQLRLTVTFILGEAARMDNLDWESCPQTMIAEVNQQNLILLHTPKS
jgi:hypothetical protein